MTPIKNIPKVHSKLEIVSAKERLYWLEQYLFYKETEKLSRETAITLADDALERKRAWIERERRESKNE